MHQKRFLKNDEILHAHVPHYQAEMYETSSLALLEGYIDANFGRDLMN